MAQRSFSVVVMPDEWAGSLDELAQAMMPVTRRGPNQVLPLLARGPMTVEADLSVEEAGLLQARLNGLGVPARVVDESGGVISESAHDGSDAGGAQAEPATAEAGTEADDARGAEVPGDSGQWANVFPDIDEPDQAEEIAQRDQIGELEDFGEFEELEELEDLEGFGDLEELSEEPVEEAGSLGDSPDEAPDDGFGAEPAPAAPPEQNRPEQNRPEQNRPEQNRPEQPPSAKSAPNKNPSPPPPQPASPGRREDAKPASFGPAGFDAGRMNDALRAEDGGRPPYAPDGFDDNVEHIPALAALLSLIAPGAGQIYNGQETKARTYGVRFALLKPWYESVRQAFDYAEKVRTYWAPRPEPGALRDALKYLLVWWALFGCVLAVLGWVGTELYDLSKVPEPPKVTQVDIDSAFEEANVAVSEARIAGLDGVTEYLDERNRNHERFTMSEKERAERLFRRAIAYCKDGDYATCASAMKRVSTLSPELRRKAYRIQAWASVSQDKRGEQPMPDVGVVESLADFEAADAGEPKAASPDAGSAEDEPHPP